MAAGAGAATQTLQPGRFDPFRFLWDLLTNVKFALLLVGLAGIASMIGVVLPQLPGPMRGNPAAREAWLELRREDFGALTDTMYRLDLFEVFYSPWFNGLWVVIVFAVTVCTVSRFAPTWRAVHRPPRQVGERYFETAHHRASFAFEGPADAVTAELRRRRYSVEEVTRRDGATYLFAERFAWSHYGTFVSHLALLMLLIGALLTRFGGFNNTFIIPETAPAFPVFADPGPGQIFVRVLDAIEGRDGAGNIVDYRTHMEVRRGDQTVACTTTVNDPCHAFGYSIHQAAFFTDFGRLRITGEGGRVLFDDIIDFNDETASVPVFRVEDPQGNLVYEQDIPQMATDPGESDGPADDTAIAFLAFGGAGRTYDVAWRVADGEMLLAFGGPDVALTELGTGESVTTPDGYRVTLVGPRLIPALTVLDMPGATSADGTTVLQMPRDRNGQPYLFVTGIDVDGRVLPAGEDVAMPSGYSFRFDGQLEASGVSVKRDPGDLFIWIAVGMAMVGLGITFYVPRRRLWVKVAPGRTYLAGIAERTTRFGREMRFIGASLGSRDALAPEDRETL